MDQTGKVTGVKAGNATITVTTKDGGKKATCSVTVSAKAISVEGVALDKGELKLTAGESAVLTAAVKPDDAADKSVAWASSDSEVATVDQSGNVTAVREGAATITVTTNDGGKTAECKVTVTAKVTAVEGVGLSESKLDLKVGRGAALKAEVKPEDATDKGVEWTSSDKEVATVDQNGWVAGVKAGSAVVTVTTNDGKKTAECQVSVTNVALEGISLDKDSETLGVGDAFALTVAYTPADATEKGVEWTSGKPDVATVDQSGKVTAVAEGVSQIVATSKDGGFKALCNVTVEGVSLSGIMLVDGIYYQSVSAGSKDVEVTNKKGGYLIGVDENDYSGSVNVPPTFEREGVTYTVKSVGNFAFYGCHSLTSVTLPEGLEEIGAYGFQVCENLEALSLPSSLT